MLNKTFKKSIMLILLLFSFSIFAKGHSSESQSSCTKRCSERRDEGKKDKRKRGENSNSGVVNFADVVIKTTLDDVENIGDVILELPKECRQASLDYYVSPKQGGRPLSSKFNEYFETVDNIIKLKKYNDIDDAYNYFVIRVKELSFPTGTRCFYALVNQKSTE